MTSKIVFFGLGLVAITGLLSPPVALVCGILFGSLFAHPYAVESRTWSKWLLQLSVVGLGFGLSFGEVLAAGRASFVYTALGIICAMALGLALGRLLHVRPGAAFLITAGTAICGGSAIAALAPLTEPDEEELAVSLGTVFALNSVALLLFPAIGLMLHLTQQQFGLWAALAIHDTSSVVGAAAKYGAEALSIGTVVKLTRALWIIPLALLVAGLRKSRARVKVPWFILFFCLAALLRSTWAAGAPLYGAMTHLAHIGLAVTLFLIGTELNFQTIRRAGVPVLLQGLLLRVIVATATLVSIRAGWIHL